MKLRALFLLAVGLFFIAPAMVLAAETPSAPVCTMQTKPATIQKGGSVTLSWQSANAVSASITGVSTQAAVNGSANLIPIQSTRYVGIFSNAAGTKTSCSATVVVIVGGNATPVVEAEPLELPGTVKAPDTVPAPERISQPESTQSPAPTLPAGSTAVPSGASQSSGLVPCGNTSGLTPGTPEYRAAATSCQACNLAQLGQNIINFLVGLSIPIAAAMFAWAGILYFSSSVVDQIQKARKIFTSVLIGFLIVLGAWLGVETLLKTILADGYYKSWNTILCVAETARPQKKTISELLSSLPGLNTTPMVQTGPAVSTASCEAGYSYSPASGLCINPSNSEDYKQPTTVAAAGTCDSGYYYSSATNLCINPDNSEDYKAPKSGAATSPVLQGTTCPTCQTVSSNFQIKSGSNGQVSASTNEFLGKFEQHLGSFDLASKDLAITEGWPPTAKHSATCHYNGTCIDLGLRGNLQYNQATVSQIQTAARNAGGCAVYETNSAAQCQGVATCKVYSHVTAPHFSVYANADCR